MKEFWKLKSTKVVLIISALLMLLCVIRLLQPNRDYQYEGEFLFQEGVPVSECPVFEGIRLPVGVYLVELDYSCSTDMQSLIGVRDGHVSPYGLLTHGEQFYSGLSQADFHMWLFEPADALEIVVTYNGAGSLRTGSLHIHETDQLWGICLTVLIAVTLLTLAALMLRWYDRQYGISRENKTVMLALAVLTALASVPYLTGMTPSGADFTYHLQRIEGIKDGILSGQFPVRLEPEWVHGHGYANGIFYCGTFLLFPALLRIVGFPVTFSYNCYAVALTAATVLIAYYCFSRIFGSRAVGVAGSALYTLSVYRIYKLVFTSAVGEGSALTFMPLVAYGFWRVFTEDRHSKAYRSSWLPLALGYAGLIQTHVLSCEITVFLTVLVCAAFLRKIFRKETFWELCKGALGALLLSLWFLVPFLDYYVREDLHIKHVWARTIQERGLYPAQLLFNWWRYGDNALLGESGMQYSHAMGVGFVLVLGFLVFGGLWFGGRFRDSDDRVWKLGKVSFVLGALLLCMSLEAFPWDRIQNSGRLAASLVSSLQFPNRFLGWASVFLVLTFCCCLYYFRRKGWKELYFAGFLCILAGSATSSLYLLDHIGRDEGHFTLYNEEGMGHGYISGAEYLVEGTSEQTLLYHPPVTGGAVEITDYEKGALRAEFQCRNASGEEGYVELPLLHYYGYRAYIGEEKQPLTVCKGDNNVVRVVIPAECSGPVTVRFVSPWYWRVAEAVSYLALLGLLILCLRRRKGEARTAWLREGILTGSVSGEQAAAAGTLGVLGVCILLAYLPYAADYLYRETEYAPLLLRLIGFSVMDAYKLFVLAVLAGTAAIAYRCFYRCTGDRCGALLGSVLYELAPCHICLIYDQNAVEGYVGMMFLPLAVCGFTAFFKKDAGQKERVKAWAALIVGLGGVLYAYGTGLSLTTAAGGSLQEQGTSLAGILQMFPYMGGEQTGLYNSRPIQAGAALWALLLLYGVIRLCRRARDGADEHPAPNRYDRVMRWGALLSVLFLLLSTRYFPWDMLARIPYVALLVQSPARFLAFTALFGSFTAAFFPLWLREESARWNSGHRSVVIWGSVLLIAMIALWSALFQVNEIAYVSEPVRQYTVGSLESASAAGEESSHE